MYLLFGEMFSIFMCGLRPGYRRDNRFFIHQFDDLLDQGTELVMSLDEIDDRRGIQENRFDFPKRFGKNHIRSSLARFT